MYLAQVAVEGLDRLGRQERDPLAAALAHDPHDAAVEAVRTGAVGGGCAIRYSGRLPAYLGSHFELVHASSALDFPRQGLEGARLRLPAGSTVRIEPGEEVELELMWS